MHAVCTLCCVWSCVQDSSATTATMGCESSKRPCCLCGAHVANSALEGRLEGWRDAGGRFTEIRRFRQAWASSHAACPYHQGVVLTIALGQESQSKRKHLQLDYSLEGLSFNVTDDLPHIPDAIGAPEESGIKQKLSDPDRLLQCLSLLQRSGWKYDALKFNCIGFATIIWHLFTTRTVACDYETLCRFLDKSWTSGPSPNASPISESAPLLNDEEGQSEAALDPGLQDH